MKRAVITLGCLGLSIAAFMSAETIVKVDRAQAQAVVSDGTVNTTVTQSGNTFTIDNGTTSGTNLFHSFREFSIPTGGAAIFNNATNIQNIFSRVTGGTASNIDGLIRANGTANLFLLNPAGILFSSNASLNIGGSFVGTTANGIRFADGTEFSAVNSASPSLLTISVPVGLQMGQNPRAIYVENSGHSLTANDPLSRVNYVKSSTGLTVQPGQAIALIGGDIIMKGGILTAEQGHLELGSAKAGLVTLNLTSPNLALDYRNIGTFGGIQLTQRSLIDASGAGQGSIALQGRQIDLSDGSLLLIQNQGINPSGNIRVQASGDIRLRGTIPDESLSSGFLTETVTQGKGGDIIVSANHLKVEDGAIIYARLFDSGKGGDVKLQIAETTTVQGVAPVTRATSLILADSLGSGQAGNLHIITGQLVSLEGGYVGSVAFSTGAAGNITIDAKDFVELRGMDLASGQPGGAGSLTLSTGDAGTLIINTKQLRVLDGAWIDNTSLAYGKGGNVIINASQSVLVSGQVPGFSVPSIIGASARTAEPILREYYNLPSVATGVAGSVTINTGELIVNDGGAISVANEGQKEAGNITLNARSIVLTQGSSITASTGSGQGGNIALNTDLLMLRHSSKVATNAGGNGNGGDIRIDAPIILGLEDSDIIANAFQGRGGNINITTQGVIGLQYRDVLTPDNDITASSEFGVNGTVQINTIGVDPNSGLIELPTNFTDASQQVAKGCGSSQGSSFVITGRGGVPTNPIEQTSNHDRTWADLRDLSTYRTQRGTTPSASAVLPTPLEATHWKRATDGKVELFANTPTLPASNAAIATCAAAIPSQ